MKAKYILAALVAAVSCTANGVKSPDKSISVSVQNDSMTISYAGSPVQGVILSAGEFTGAGRTVRIDESYTMLSGKRSQCHNSARARVFHFAGCDIEVRACNDGVAFRYLTEGGEPETAFNVPDGTRRWLQRKKDDYEMTFPLLDKAVAGDWGYPALFEYRDGVFGLITEADVTENQCGSCLHCDDGAQTYKVVPYDENPSYKTSPWRVLILGSLADIVESTLVTDLAEPCVLEDTSWIEPGVSAWVYWANNHGSRDFQVVKDYIDLSAEMGWKYDLIDWEWEFMENGGTVEDAIAYAREKGIKVNLWYNSGTSWNGPGAPGAPFVLMDAADREAELSRLESMGVSGIKVDFFKNDGQEIMKYYVDILRDAARHHLLVDFHGCTIPRGWQRTWPNMMSMESVFGAEWYNNVPFMTDLAAAHNATLPFTRNVVGPMDYTPGTFSDSQHPHITSDGHELALTVLFESGLQHMPDRPSVYREFPEEVQNFFRGLPAAWDDVRLLGGYPGEYAVLARRSGDKWYIAGINGTNSPKTLEFSLRDIEFGPVTLFTDTPDGLGISYADNLPASIECPARGGFVAVTK